jgi:hypothetical protein
MAWSPEIVEFFRCYRDIMKPLAVRFSMASCHTGWREANCRARLAKRAVSAQSAEVNFAGLSGFFR